MMRTNSRSIIGETPPQPKLHDQATTLLGVMQGMIGLCIAWGFITHSQANSLSDPGVQEGIAFLVTGLLSAVKGFYTNK